MQREQGKALKDICEEDLHKKQISLLAEENKALKEKLKEQKKKEPTLPVIVRNVMESPEAKVNKRATATASRKKEKQVDETKD